MDRFKFHVLLKNLRTNPLEYTVDEIEEYTLTLSNEDLGELFKALSSKTRPAKEAKHTLDLLQVLWTLKDAIGQI